MPLLRVLRYPTAVSAVVVSLFFRCCFCLAEDEVGSGLPAAKCSFGVEVFYDGPAGGLSEFLREEVGDGNREIGFLDYRSSEVNADDIEALKQICNLHRLKVGDDADPASISDPLAQQLFGFTLPPKSEFYLSNKDGVTVPVSKGFKRLEGLAIYNTGKITFVRGGQRVVDLKIQSVDLVSQRYVAGIRWIEELPNLLSLSIHSQGIESANAKPINLPRSLKSCAITGFSLHGMEILEAFANCIAIRELQLQVHSVNDIQFLSHKGGIQRILLRVQDVSGVDRVDLTEFTSLQSLTLYSPTPGAASRIKFVRLPRLKRIQFFRERRRDGG